MRFFIVINIFIFLLFANTDTNTTKDANSTNISEKTTIILSQKTKETNETNVSIKTSLRLLLINTYNNIMPSFLQVTPKENFFHYAYYYDIKNKKSSQSLSINVILPSFEKTVKKTSLGKLKTKTKSKTYTFRVVPFLTMYKSSPALVIKSSFSFEVENIVKQLSKNFAFSETVYYYAPKNDYKEISQISLKRFVTINNLMFKATKTIYSSDPKTIQYSFATYFYNDYFKYIKVYGLTTSGSTDEHPFIYSYKLFFTYSHILFNQKVFYITFSPYLLWSKEYNYHMKKFADISLHVKF